MSSYILCFNRNKVFSLILLTIQQIQLIYLSFFNIQSLIEPISFEGKLINRFKQFFSFFMVKPLLEHFIEGSSEYVGSFGNYIHYSFYTVILVKLLIDFPKKIEQKITYAMSFVMKTYNYILFAPIFTSLVDS